MSVPTKAVAASVHGLVNQLRAFDRFASGRQVATLAAIGVLASKTKSGSEAWSEFRGIAGNFVEHPKFADRLFVLGSDIEAAHVGLERVLSATLIPDVLQAGANLPELVELASVVVDRFSADINEFGQWFDVFIDEISAGKQVGEVTTPKPLAQLLARLAAPEPASSVLDPACGLGATLREMAALAPEGLLHGEEVNALALAIVRLRLYLLGLKVQLQLGDALRSRAGFEGKDQSRFDRVVCDPPYGLTVSRTAGSELRERFSHLPTRRSEGWFVQHCLESLKPNGRAVVLLPIGFLVRRGGEAEFRKSLIERGRIEGVVALPGGVIPWTDAAAAVVILRGDDMPGAPIVLVDASFLLTFGKRATDRLTSETVNEIVSLYQSSEDPTRTVLVDPAQILAKDLDLHPKTWVQSKKSAAPSVSELYKTAQAAEARAADAKREFDDLMVYFKLRAPLHD